MTQQCPVCGHAVTTAPQFNTGDTVQSGDVRVVILKADPVLLCGKLRWFCKLANTGERGWITPENAKEVIQVNPQ